MDQFYNAAASAIQQSVNANNQWSAEQAQKQMDFQREMSNTAHQREIADLKAAGLNPVLSAKLGGASTPSGAMASGDTSGTSALIDLLQMAMSTANSASVAAARSAGSGAGNSGSAKSESETPVISNDTLKDVARNLPKGLLRTFLLAYSSISEAVGNDGIKIEKGSDAGLSSRYGYLKAQEESDSGSSNGSHQISLPFLSSAKDLVKDLDKIFYLRKPSYSVTYNGDGKSKGSSVWHAGGGSSKRVATLK